MFLVSLVPCGLKEQDLDLDNTNCTVAGQQPEIISKAIKRRV